jgi:predicted peroxiredoxin
MSNQIRQSWKRRDRFLEIRSHWVTLIGEHLEDDKEQNLEYWRVEKSDSAVILPIQNQQIILPPPTYRPGVGTITWDLPGGRISEGENTEDAVANILQRELGIDMKSIIKLTALTTNGWAVNSSFSNQKLFGFVAEIKPDIRLSKEFIDATYPVTQTGVNNLLKALTCLQCRSIVLEWWLLKYRKIGDRTMTTTVKDGVFLHISRGSEDPHRVLMALALAEKMVEDKDVLIFFDIKGVEVPLKQAKAIEFPAFESAQTLLPKLIDKGVQVCVCPMCLKAAKYQPEDLIAGVKLAAKDAFFNFTEGRILSLDY